MAANMNVQLNQMQRHITQVVDKMNQSFDKVHSSQTDNPVCLPCEQQQQQQQGQDPGLNGTNLELKRKLSYVQLLEQAGAALESRCLKYQSRGEAWILLSRSRGVLIQKGSKSFPNPWNSKGDAMENWWEREKTIR